jgi:cysteine desulfuration protein SufE
LRIDFVSLFRRFVDYLFLFQMLPMRLDELITELDELEPDEKLAWLVEFADELPDLTAGKLAEPFPETCLVRECQTPVHLWVTAPKGRIHLEADVPRKSVLVRGLVALVVCGLEGATVAEGLALPEDMVAHLSLASGLGMTRQQGFRGVISRIKRELRALID